MNLVSSCPMIMIHLMVSTRVYLVIPIASIHSFSIYLWGFEHSSREPSPSPDNVDIYWTAAGAMYAYLFGELSIAGVDVLGHSQVSDRIEEVASCTFWCKDLRSFYLSMSNSLRGLRRYPNGGFHCRNTHPSHYWTGEQVAFRLQQTRSRPILFDIQKRK